MMGTNTQQISKVHQYDVTPSTDSDCIFSLDYFQRKISSLKQVNNTKSDTMLVTPLSRDTSIDPGTSDTPILHT